MVDRKAQTKFHATAAWLVTAALCRSHTISITYVVTYAVTHA